MAARDIIMFAIIIFAVGIGFFVINYAMDTTINRMVNVTAINESNQTVNVLTSIKTNVTSRLDYVLFGLFIALILGIIITSWFIGGNPIFAFIYFLVIVIGVIASTIMADVWENISGASVFGLTVVSFPITNHILSKLPIYVAIVGFIGIVIMFAKPQVTQ